MTPDHQLTTLLPEWFGTRHKQMLLSYLALLVFGLQSTSLVVGIVAMTESSNSSSFPTFDFSISQKGLLLGMFGYGCAVGTGLFGYLADLYGPTRISAISGGICSSLVSFAFPWLTKIGGFEFACAAQVLQGFMSGSVWPCVFAHMSRWVVPQEQSNFAWIWTGYQCGCVLSSLLPGPLANLMGWPAFFYFAGGLGLMCGAFVLVWGADCPADHKSININEKMFIESRIPAQRNCKMKTALVEMLKSKPFWVLLIVQCCDWFGWFVGPPFEPIYLNQVFNLSVTEGNVLLLDLSTAIGKTEITVGKLEIVLIASIGPRSEESEFAPLWKVGYVTAFNWILKTLALLIQTYLAVKVSTCVSTNVSRKMWNSVGMYGGAIAFFLMAIVPQSAIAAITFNGVIAVMNSAVQLGYVITVLDMAPNLAGTLAGLLTAISNVVGSTAPIITGLLILDETDGNSWSLVFWMGGAVNVLGNTVFLVMGSTDLQAWNNPSPTLEMTASASNDPGPPLHTSNKSRMGHTTT